jgi:hypothetical protein
MPLGHEFRSNRPADPVTGAGDNDQWLHHKGPSQTDSAARRWRRVKANMCIDVGAPKLSVKLSCAGQLSSGLSSASQGLQSATDVVLNGSPIVEDIVQKSGAACPAK